MLHIDLQILPGTVLSWVLLYLYLLVNSISAVHHTVDKDTDCLRNFTYIRHLCCILNINKKGRTSTTSRLLGQIPGAQDCSASPFNPLYWLYDPNLRPPAPRIDVHHKLQESDKLCRTLSVRTTRRKHYNNRTTLFYLIALNRRQPLH
jgi:hypothetical protein